MTTFILKRLGPNVLGVLGAALLVACGTSNADEGISAPSKGTTAEPIIAAGTTDAALIRQTVAPAAVHCDPVVNIAAKNFVDIFDCGDDLFSAPFNEFDGGGANVGNGKRYTRVPRADLTGNDANGRPRWAAHFPPRATGPNAQSCSNCHLAPFDGAGPPESHAARDPARHGLLAEFIERNTPHLFMLGGLQLAAEEMTTTLQAAREAGRAGLTGTQTRSVALTAKNISFGTIVVGATAATDDTTGVTGVDPTLIVKPFQWKGAAATVRDFMNDAAHNELGMDSQEITGAGIDGDGDGVVDELTYADITAMAVYMASQARPTTQLEINALGLIDPPLTAADIASINRGSAIFSTAIGTTVNVGGVAVTGVGCATCHVPDTIINSPVFSEPSQNVNYRPAVFQGGVDPADVGVDFAAPARANLATDLFDNVNVPTASGRTVSIGGLELVNPANPTGQAHVRAFTDFKRHDMGPGLAEPVPDGGVAPNIWMTRSLWGIGSTAPYLHDGRAISLMGAILEHGGDATASANAVRGTTAARRRDLVRFLNNLILFEVPAATTPVTPPPPPTPAVTASLVVNTDWGAGFCATINVSSTTAVSAWSAVVNIGTGATVSSSWNSTTTGTTGNVTFRSNASWQAIPAGGTISSTGFCANRANAPAVVCTTNVNQAVCPRAVSAAGTP